MGMTHTVPTCRECNLGEIESDDSLGLCECCYDKMYEICDECEERYETEEGQDGMCPDCHDEHYCECGQRLEDSYGQPGDGFCCQCR